MTCGACVYPNAKLGGRKQRLAVFKLASMVESSMWNDVADILIAVVDQSLVVWYYPHAPTADKDLLHHVKLSIDW